MLSDDVYDHDSDGDGGEDGDAGNDGDSIWSQYCWLIPPEQTPIDLWIPIDVTHQCQINIVKAPFAWVSAEEIEGGRTRLTLEKASARKTESKTNRSAKNNKSARVGRQNLLSDTNKPLLK